MKTEDTGLDAEGKEILFSSVKKRPVPEYNGEKEKKKVAVIFSRVYFLALVALVVGLYAYVLVENIKSGNEVLIAKTAYVSVAVLIESFIFIITAFGLWSKFLGKVFHTDSKQVVEERETPPELKQSALDDELYIYRDSVRIVGLDGNFHIPFSRLTRVEYIRYGKDYCLVFYMKGNLKNCTIPARSFSIDKIKKLLPCPVLPYDTGTPSKKEPRIRRRPDWLNKDTIGGLVMALFALGAGVAVTVLHFLVDERMPLFLGVFFMLGGLMAFCGVLGHNSKWCNNVVIPVLFALIFVVFTVGFFPAMYTELGVRTVREVMMSEPYTVCFFGLAGLGLYLVYAAILNAVNLIRKK
ncbi:MAG: hypothetical protein K2K12_01505 [Clostridia bacterium]|nr:hypothetical protein [Clostridia bacterium]